MASKKENLTGADRNWGFRFGVDGVVSIREATQITSLGRTKIDELLEEGLLRKGKVGRKVIICRRSITEYLSRVEV